MVTFFVGFTGGLGWECKIQQVLASLRRECSEATEKNIIITNVFVLTLLFKLTVWTFFVTAVSPSHLCHSLAALHLHCATFQVADELLRESPCFYFYRELKILILSLVHFSVTLCAPSDGAAQQRKWQILLQTLGTKIVHIQRCVEF